MRTGHRGDGLLVACALLVCACADAEDKSQLSADVAPALPERSIKLFNTHTNETVSVVFKRGDDVIAENLMLPLLKAGGLIVGRAMGAYTWASASEFSVSPKATVVTANRKPGDTGAVVSLPF